MPLIFDLPLPELSTQFAAYNKITAAKRLELYPDFAHKDLKGHQDRIFEFMLGMCS